MSESPEHEYEPPVDGAAGAPPEAPNTVLSRSFSLLSAFEPQDDVLRLITLTKRTGLPKATVYRLAQELTELRVLERTEGGYRPGFGLYALGQRVSMPALLRSAARPVMVDLSAATHATFHLSILDGKEIYYVDRIGGAHGLNQLVGDAGSRMPSYCTASGRLLLALSPDSGTAVAGVASAPMPRLTPRFTANQVDFRERIGTARARKLSTERGEVERGYMAFAVPITDAADNTVAALSATIPIDYRAEAQLVDYLRSASTAVSRRLRSLARVSESRIA